MSIIRKSSPRSRKDPVVEGASFRERLDSVSTSLKALAQAARARLSPKEREILDRKWSPR